MIRNNKGITMIALVITIVVLLIIAGVSIGSIANGKGIINEAKEGNSQLEKQSVIEAIESELYKERVKAGGNITKKEVQDIIAKYGTINEEAQELTTKEGHKILFNEITGWKDAK